jgi:glycosyltransferase involved in cell wall biosynthesis
MRTRSINWKRDIRSQVPPKDCALSSNKFPVLVKHSSDISVLLTTAGAWYLRETAMGLQARNHLAGLWISEKNTTGIRKEFYRRCWPFHTLMKPFYHAAPQILVERMFYRFFPAWRTWLLRQPLPPFNVMHAIVGYATEPFQIADRIGALKVVDLPNSHPTSYFGYWQRECDLWCPGHTVPIPRWMFARMNRELEEADLILCASNFVRDTVIQNGIAESKCFVNPFGVDTLTFRRRTELPMKPRFISVGTICLRKGHQYLFRAFEMLKTRVPEAELICVGEYKADFAKERSRWQHMFVHMPSLSHLAVADLMRCCTAFVFPSREEGIARAQIEALASGLPVIGTYEGGATTLIQDGVEGFIVRGNQPHEIAEAMYRLATDSDLNRRMGDAAYIRGAEGNSWRDYSDRLLSAYERALLAKRVAE